MPKLPPPPRLATVASSLAFYGLAVILGGGAVALSFGVPPRLAGSAAQAGELQAGVRRFGPEALQHASVYALDLHVPRDVLGRAGAVRLAVPLAGLREGAGLRIAFTPEAAAAFAGRALSIEVDVKALEITGAEELAVRLEGDVAWSVQPLPAAGAKTLRFELRAGAEGPAGLWLRPQTLRNDYAYGVEVRALRVAAR